MKRKAKAPVRPQNVSRESERGTNRFQIPERSNCLSAGRSCGCGILHSDGQGQDHRAFPSRARKRWSRFWEPAISSAKDAWPGRLCAWQQSAALTECAITRIPKADIIRVIHKEPAFAELFISHLLARNSRVEADLVDQLFNSSEKRLARTLLLLANFGKEGRARAGLGENQPRDARGDHRHDTSSRQLFHEQISAIGPH